MRSGSDGSISTAAKRRGSAACAFAAGSRSVPKTGSRAGGLGAFAPLGCAAITLSAGTAGASGCSSRVALPLLDSSLSRSAIAPVKDCGDGIEAVERFAGSAGDGICGCASGKPTSAISATVTRASPPTARSETENCFCSKVGFMTSWAKKKSRAKKSWAKNFERTHGRLHRKRGPCRGR